MHQLVSAQAVGYAVAIIGVGSKITIGGLLEDLEEVHGCDFRIGLFEAGGEPELTSYDEYADDDDASSWASGATIESEPEVSFDWYAFREQQEVVFNWRNAERDAQADAPLGPQNAPGENGLPAE